MTPKNAIEKFALSFAACSLALAALSPFLRKQKVEEELYLSAPLSEKFEAEAAQTPAVDTFSGRKRRYIPYTEVAKQRAEMVAQLTERYKNAPIYDCSMQAKGIVHRVNLPPCDSCKTLFLTLDACISDLDSMLLKYLIYNKINTSIFVTTRWINSWPQAVQLLLTHRNIFEVENHGWQHRPASVNGCTQYKIRGTKSMAELVAEVEIGAEIVERTTGEPPLFFRSGTAFADNVAVAAIGDMGYRFIGFSVAADEGATLPRHTVKQRILAAQHGDIILMHLNSKSSETRLGFIMAMEEMKQKNVCVRFAKLRNFTDKFVAY
ncbi:MAG: polysaccharide deacetylase family protein [Prevotellaceae bacterium]|jgi:peptidoglycan/xylan/chitin deacetylase (PgdA/CDA1 family)|nr:polysaccharide deacetylase family protein [Prevotellaceae bacterium]